MDQSTTQWATDPASLGWIPYFHSRCCGCPQSESGSPVRQPLILRNSRKPKVLINSEPKPKPAQAASASFVCLDEHFSTVATMAELGYAQTEFTEQRIIA
jgi:hypothetical protein